MGLITVRTAKSDEDRESARQVRTAVFQVEQKISRALDFDAADDDAHHVLAVDGETPVGAARFREIDSSAAKIERVAVLKTYRGRRIGVAIMAHIEVELTTLGFAVAQLNSQLDVADFYVRLGYEIIGKRFNEAGLPHVRMRKVL
jgi:predicted GNAT family N-acyltransferase